MKSAALNAGPLLSARSAVIGFALTCSLFLMSTPIHAASATVGQDDLATVSTILSRIQQSLTALASLLGSNEVAAALGAVNGSYRLTAESSDGVGAGGAPIGCQYGCTSGDAASISMPTNAYVDPKTVPLDATQTKPPTTFGEPTTLCKLNDGNLSQNDCYLTIHNAYARYRETYWPIYQRSNDSGYGYPAFQIVVIEEIAKTNAARSSRPAAGPNTDPRGYLDAVSCELIAGWAQDTDTPHPAIDVHIYIDKPPAVGDLSGFVGAVTANQWRDDLCSGIGSCSHAFTYPTPTKFKDGKPHKVYAYAINTPTGNNPLLSLAPKEFTCAAPKPTCPAPSQPTPTCAIGSHLEGQGTDANGCYLPSKCVADVPVNNGSIGYYLKPTSATTQEGQNVTGFKVMVDNPNSFDVTLKATNGCSPVQYQVLNYRVYAKLDVGTEVLYDSAQKARVCTQAITTYTVKAGSTYSFTLEHKDSDYHLAAGTFGIRARLEGLTASGNGASITLANKGPVGRVEVSGIPTGISGTITSPSTSRTGKPTITGTAKGITKVGIAIGDGDKVYGSGPITVSRRVWSHTLTSTLVPGTYTVYLYSDQNILLATSPLTVRASASNFSLSDVKSVTAKYVDPIKNAADDEYTLYVITLKSGRKVEVKVGFMTSEMRDEAFRKTGYTGTISELMAMATRAGVSVGPFGLTDVSKVTFTRIDLTTRLYSVVLKGGGTTQVKIGDMSTYDERTQAFAAVGYTGEVNQIVALGIPVGTDAFTISDVQSVTFTRTAESNCPDCGSVTYTVALKSGRVVLIQVGNGPMTQDMYTIQFRNAGYQGDIQALTMMAVQAANTVTNSTGKVLGVSTSLEMEISDVLSEVGQLLAEAEGALR